ncbi:hypothetical protein LguiA_024793 [Lonicera macranthoides]
MFTSGFVFFTLLPCDLVCWLLVLELRQSDSSKCATRDEMAARTEGTIKKWIGDLARYIEGKPTKFDACSHDCDLCPLNRASWLWELSKIDRLM